MAIVETIFCKIFGVISAIVEKVAGERFTICIDFNENMHTLEENLQVLTSKASDIETKVKNVELLGKKKRSTEVGNWLEKVGKFKIECDKLQEAGFCKPLLQGSHVKKLIEGVGELIKQSQTFHEVVVDACETSGVHLFMTKLHGETLKRDLDKILAWLEAKSDQVLRIGVYGMGGVGKTNLAKHICTNLQGKPDKVHVYHLTVSQEVDINKLQNDLAQELDFDLPKDNDIEKRAVILNRVLIEKKNVVLVLDDVWKYFDLRKIGIPLGADGCKVIITSRLLDICNQMGCKTEYIIKVQPLSEEETWKLFVEKLGYELNPEVEEVAKIMAKKCAGLPLGIITLARSMSGVYDIHEWRDALEELKQSTIGKNEMKNEVLPILQNSYKRLRDPRLQQCFLFCSLYPEDYEIPRDELINQFIYKGVMHQRESRAAEFDQGHTILNRLVNVCLLDSVVDYKGEKFVMMHDLLREMAVEIARNNPRFMVKAGLRLYELPDEQEWTEDLDKVSLMRNYISEIPEGSSPRCPRVTTLILLGNPLKLIPDCFFAHMHGLRVLDLRYTDIEKLPNSIAELQNLTALLLGGCYQLWYVPSLKKLKALMELDISNTQIKEVPEGMECLVKLKCLNMKSADELTEIPAGFLPRLSRLQRLILPLHIKVPTEELESLKLLEEFEGWADDMCNSNWFNKSPPLSFYNIKEGDDKSRYGTYIYTYERQIICRECTFKRSGGDVLLMPQNIQCLEIEKCKGLSDCLLEVDPSLYKDFKNCRIEECDEIESILRISSSSKDEGALQKLEYLSLSKLPNFIGLIKLEQPRAIAVPPSDTFSSLKGLTIYDCHKIKKLVPHKLLVQNLQNLEVIDVSLCNQMEEIIADDEEDEGVSSTSTSSSSNSRSNNKNSPTSSSSVSSTDPSSIAFPKLREIQLESLPLLKSIYKGNIICCDSIWNIEITDCPELKRLPFFHPSADERPPPPSASSSSSSSSSYCNNYGTATYIFPKLTYLTLRNVPELKSICDGIMICDSIYSISVKECTQLTRLPLFLPLVDGQPSPPPSLRRIYLNETEREWWESLEWDHPNSNNVLEPFLEYGEKKQRR